MGCVQTPTGSMHMTCSSTSSADVFYYLSNDCSTGYTGYSPASFDSCEGGTGMQCLTSDEIPEFATKEGLYT